MFKGMIGSYYFPHCVPRRLWFCLFGACLSGGPLFAQPKEAKGDSLYRSFTRYQSSSFREKVFVHTDKTFYLAGEIIWFKVYEVDASFHRPVKDQDISYIEVFSQGHKPVLQARVDMKDGKGAGSFALPVTIPSGNYTLRAYTSWMRNFSPEFFFCRDLTILNTLTEGVVEEGAPAGVLPAVVGGAPSVAASYTIRFFPEGGNLVAGLPSTVACQAVKAAGRNEKGISGTGVIVNQMKDTVARFSTTRFGMGRFTWTPRKGDSYSAIFTVNAAGPVGSTSAAPAAIFASLPAVYDEGTTMHLTEEPDGRIKISVHSNLHPSDPTIYLFVHTRQIARVLQFNYLSDGVSVFFIDPKSLGDGVSHITLFNAGRIPLCERLYFKPPGRPLQIDVTLSGLPLASGPAAVSADTVSRPAADARYHTRQRIDATFSVTDQDGVPVSADLSGSVFLVDSLQSIPSDDLRTYLLLTADLRGPIESPGFYFDGPAMAPADDLMLTQGWSRFRWEDVLKNAPPTFEFLPELNGPVISGKITDKRTGQPASSVMGYLSAPGKSFEFGTALSDANGRVRFNIDNLYGPSEIITQTNSQTADSNYRIDLTSPFSDKFPGSMLPPSSSGVIKSSPGAERLGAGYGQWQDQLVARSINVQAGNTYRIAEQHRFSPLPAADSFSFFGRPDLKYYLDDYTHFVTLEEVLREYIGDVRVRRANGSFHFRVRNATLNLFFEEDPLVLLDGVPVFDLDKLMALEPARIRRIEVVSHRFYTGPLASDGIVSFKTYEGDLGGYTLDPNAVALEYNGLQQQREFYSPVYDTPARSESRIPDFRNTLSWSPSIMTDSSGRGSLSFYTSDLTGDFVLLVQGITDSGLPGSKILRFHVAK